MITLLQNVDGYNKLTAITSRKDGTVMFAITEFDFVKVS